MNDRISLIQIDAENCYEVSLITKKTNEISIEAQIEGEYSTDLELRVMEKESMVMVNAGFQPNFINPNDKLSAHKVVSIALRIVVPEWKNVLLYGTNTRVLAKGDYKSLNVSLADGSCNLINVSQDVEVKTQSGNIYISSRAANIHANSKYGKIGVNPIPFGDNQYNLNTVTGNIVLNKTE